MNKTYKILALLLNYPNQELQESLGSLTEILKEERLLNKDMKSLMDHLQNSDLLDLQEEYVSLFDRGRSVSLHLFEHIHGESRDRGQAMVDLSNLYKENGLEIDSSELPDFLPLFLEFLATLDQKKAAELLGEPIDIIALIGARLKQKNSLYAAIFSALQSLSAKKAKKITLEKAKEKSDKEINKEIDKEWEDPQVTFLGADKPASCNSCVKSC